MLITGATGQLGRELVAAAPAGCTLVALGRGLLDVTDARAVSGALLEHRPTVVLNAAAYTAVDRAEDEADEAYAANVRGPGNLAEASAAIGARLIHVSSDYVFDGAKSTPYLPGDEAIPLGVYGRSKREGELAVLAANPLAVIVRSAWLHSVHGPSFVHSILRQARERGPLRVVGDQVGSPTWASALASVIWRLAGKGDVSGILHYADAGVASWYDLAMAVVEEAAARGLLTSMVSVEPLVTGEYPARAVRPAFSVLDSRATRTVLGHPAVHWRVNLRNMLDRMTTAGG